MNATNIQTSFYMGHHPCLDIIKVILSDKSFNLESFLRTGFSTFWYKAREYLDECHAAAEKKKGKKLKAPECKNLFTALERVVPSAKACNYPDDVHIQVNQVLATFLHYQTATEWRKRATSLLFLVLTEIDPKDYDAYRRACSMVVPYVLFSVDDTETALFKKAFGNVNPILDGQPPPTLDEACDSLTTLMDFVRGIWNSKTDLALNMLFVNVIYVLFRVFAEPSDRMDEIAGFRNSPPERLQALFMKLFEQWLSPQYSLLPLLRERSDIMLLLKAFRDCAGRQQLSQYLFVIGFFNKVFSDSDTRDALLKPGSFVMVDLAKVVSSFLAVSASKQRVPGESLVTEVFKFCCGFSDCLFTNFKREEGLLIATQLFKDSHYDMYAASFMVLDLLGYVMTRGEWGSELWHSLTSIITSRECLSAVAANFGQFLAAYIFPVVFQVDGPEARDICINHVRRVQRTRQVTPHDFMAENMDVILDDPHKFARESLEAYYPPHKEYQWLCKNLRIRPFREGKPVDEEAISDAIRFVDAFEFYTDLEDIEAKRLAFAPIIAFSHAMVTLSTTPPGVAKYMLAPYELCSRRLFRAILAQSDPVIRRMAFEVLSQMFNLTMMKEHVDGEDLTNWYAALIVMILGTDESGRDLGFRQAIRTVQLGFSGSSILIGFLMNVAESGIIPTNESIMSLISSFPLLLTDSKLPDAFVKSVKERLVKDKDSYIPNAVAILEKAGGPLRERAITMLKALKDQGDWPLILPVYSVLLADELAKDSPTIKLVVFILDTLLLPIEAQSFEAIVVIRSMLMYSQKLQKLVAADFTRFIEKLSKSACALTPTVPAQWSIELIKLMTDVYVECSQLIKWSSSYMEFANFLITSLRGNNNFEESVKNCMGNMCDILMMFYGTYPFHQTSYFPTITQLFTDKKEATMAAIGKTLIMPRFEEDTVKFSVENSTGQYIWSFKDVSEYLCEPQDIEPFSIPLSTKADKIEPASSHAAEKEFIDLFDGVVSHAKDYFSCEFANPARPEGQEDIYEAQVKAMEEIDEKCRNVESKPTEHHRPKVDVNNQAAGALTACGRFSIKYPENLSMIEHNSHAVQLTKTIQVLNYRLGVKIGVVYVGEGCDNQNQILRTTYEETSKYFREFVTGLGWCIDIPTHVGYDGGLDRKNASNGKSSIFYSDFMNEIMFHVAPLIPTDPTDEQQVYKKRHIGNDHIHVVWCASNQDYDTSTITSQFNQAHIVIYPLETGLFRVEIFWQKDLPWFGPLRWPVVVTKRALPSLIRATSMSAMNSYYSTHKEYVDPQVNIANNITEIMTKKSTDESPYDAIRKLMMFRPE